MSGEAFRNVSDEPVVNRLLCQPADEPAPAPAAVRPSKVRADCGHTVWMSPSGIRLWEQTNVIAVCLPCGRRTPSAHPMGVVASQYRELVSQVGEAEAQRLVKAHGVERIGDMR